MTRPIMFMSTGTGISTVAPPAAPARARAPVFADDVVHHLHRIRHRTGRARDGDATRRARRNLVARLNLDVRAGFRLDGVDGLAAVSDHLPGALARTHHILARAARRRRGNPDAGGTRSERRRRERGAVAVTSHVRSRAHRAHRAHRRPARAAAGGPGVRPDRARTDRRIPRRDPGVPGRTRGWSGGWPY